MGETLSWREQRAADIRTSLLEYGHSGPWSTEHRGAAVFRGVQRNNARRQQGGCCNCCCWLIVLIVVLGLVCFTWMRVIQAGQDFITNFPGLEPKQNCGNQTSVVQLVNCTLNYCTLLSENLARLWEEAK